MPSFRQLKWPAFAALVLIWAAMSSCGGSSGGGTSKRHTSTPTPTATPRPATGEGLLGGFILND